MFRCLSVTSETDLNSFVRGIFLLLLRSSNLALQKFSTLGRTLMFKLVSLITGLALAGNLSAQVEPQAGQWKTWVIPSGSALRLPAPPDAADTAAEIQWLKDSAAARNQA